MSRCFTLLIVLLISRVDVVTAGILEKGSLQGQLDGKILHDKDKVFSGEIYRIQSTSIFAKEELTVQITGNGYSKTYKTEATFSGYLKIAIPFIVDPSNSTLKNLTGVNIKVVEKDISINNLDIRKPALYNSPRGVILKKFIQYAQSENEDVIAKAQLEGKTSVVDSSLPFREILADVLSQLETAGTVSVTADTETGALSKNGIDLFEVMIAGAIDGIINENSIKSLDGNNGHITLENIQPFFDTPNNFNPETIVLGIREINLANLQKANGVEIILVAFVAVMVGMKLYQLFWKYGIGLKLRRMYEDLIIGVRRPTFLACNNPKMACIDCLTASQNLFTSVDTDLQGSPIDACLTISNTSGPSPLQVTFDSSCTTDPSNNLHRMSITVDGVALENCGRFNDYRSYTSSGAHTVSVIAFDTNGASSTKSYNYNVTITGGTGDKKDKQDYFNELVMKPFNDLINGPKTAFADFTYFPTSGNFGAYVYFNGAVSSGPYILDYIWQFSDGSPTQFRCWPKFERGFSQTTGITLSVFNKDGETATSAEKFVLISNGD